MAKYKTRITEYGYGLINAALSGEGILITDGWYIALGDGELEPAFDVVSLNHIVFDKNSSDYPGIIISKNQKGRYAEIVLPESLNGVVITEIGLYDDKDCLVACANTKIDCTERTDEGFDIDYRARIDLGAVSSDVVIQFQGGTFQILEEKGEAGGYAPLNSEAKVPLEHLPSSFIPFCFNSGAVDENGEPALLQLSTVMETVPPETEGGEETIVTKQIITLKAPATYTDGNGRTVNITEDLTLDVTNFIPGKTYSLRVQETEAGIIFSAQPDVKVYRQKNPPENPNAGDLWQNLSVAPELAYIYSVLATDDEDSKTPTGVWQITNVVEAGVYTAPETTENSENSGGGGS